MNTKRAPSPEYQITPEIFVRNAWDMDFRISTADSSALPPDFIKNTTSLAEKEGIIVHSLDFSEYESAVAALTAKESSCFLEAIENDGGNKSLLWFVNCESLAPLNVDITYSLRTILTTRIGSNTQSVFISTKASLLMMFANPEAPFYQSHFRLTGYSS
ncbi:hypothetical protein AB4249_18230 [Vibrio sp. 10N.261.55.F4]|uniref:hypothetical protein n=1 Tax=Vibrio sp. 10N.261.55.F4 TaxID=3229692 RepID=UPI00354CD244